MATIIRSIGVADDVPGVSGAMDWKAARKEADDRANKELVQVGLGAEPTSRTVADAITAYKEQKRRRGQLGFIRGIKVVEGKHLGTLGAVRLDRPGLPHLLQAWVAGLDGGLGNETRDWYAGIVKTALRIAGVDPAIIRKGIEAQHRGPKRSRMVVLEADAVRRFVDATYRVDLDLGLLINTMAQTGARPVQLGYCTRADLDVTEAILVVPPSNKGGHGRSSDDYSPLPLTQGLVGRLVARMDAVGIGPDRLLLTRAEKVRVRASGGQGFCWEETGRRLSWNCSDGRSGSDYWARGVRKAAELAGLDQTMVLYALRHNRVQEIFGGEAHLHPVEVASSLNTSIHIMSAHYTRHSNKRRGLVERLRASLPDDAA